MSQPARSIARILDAVPSRGGALRRVVGGLDCRGQGLAFPLREAGPFVYVEDAVVDGPGQPPFGMHPHAGLVALSWVPRGGPWVARSNADGHEELALSAGELLVTGAGRGVVHEETSVGPGEHTLLQMVLRLPRARSADPPSVARLAPVRVGTGIRRAVGVDDLARFGLEAAVWLVDLDAGAAAELDPGPWPGFVFARAGEVTLGDARLAPGQVAELEATGALSIRAGTAGAELVIAVGATPDEPWAKQLGHGGFVVARDAAAAAELLARYAEDPADFGR